jgi:cell division cycle 2-like protein
MASCCKKRKLYTKSQELIEKKGCKNAQESNQGGCIDSQSNFEKSSISTHLHNHGVFDMHGRCRPIDEFEMLDTKGEGAFGIVSRARNKKTHEIVAIKELKISEIKGGIPLSFLREINILKSLCHPSIVNLKEVVVKESASDNIFDTKYFIVMEYVEHNFKAYMDSMKQPFSQTEVKKYMLQLISGVKYMHNNWFMHRDLKPSNILLNNRGELKLCDFGMARQYGDRHMEYTHEVVTLWYRAPELLLGAKEYSIAIDMWSLGCNMGEFLQQRPLFPGISEVDQIYKIFKTLGTPNEKIWPNFTKLRGAQCKYKNQPFNKLREMFPAIGFGYKLTLSRKGFDLLNRLLTYDPSKRITAHEAFNHEWFQE